MREREKQERQAKKERQEIKRERNHQKERETITKKEKKLNSAKIKKGKRKKASARLRERERKKGVLNLPRLLLPPGPPRAPSQRRGRDAAVPPPHRRRGQVREPRGHLDLQPLESDLSLRQNGLFGGERLQLLRDAPALRRLVDQVRGDDAGGAAANQAAGAPPPSAAKESLNVNGPIIRPSCIHTERLARAETTRAWYFPEYQHSTAATPTELLTPFAMDESSLVVSMSGKEPQSFGESPPRPTTSKAPAAPQRLPRAKIATCYLNWNFRGPTRAGPANADAACTPAAKSAST